MFTDINIYSINNKTDHISEKYIFYRNKYFSYFRSDLEPDPLFNETDPRIHIKMKRIRNTGKTNSISSSLPVGLGANRTRTGLLDTDR